MADASPVSAGGARAQTLAPLPFDAVKVMLAALVVVTLFRLWFISRMQLFPDEAYYWLWSKNLALSYRDKGPLVAWFIALGTKLFGDTAFGIRVFAVLCLSGTSWILFSLARRLFDERTALWCFALVLFIPLFAAEAIIMTIDPMSILSWAWGLSLFWTAIHSGRIWHWILLGVVIGLGFLAKFTNGVQLVSIALFLLWSRPHRKYFFSRQSILMCLAFCLTISPLLWWNYQTGWVHAMALSSRSGAEGSFGIHPAEFFQFVGGQFLVLSPLLGLGMLVAVLGLARRQHDDPRIRLLLTQLIPLTGIFLFFSLNKAGKENWTAPALLAGIVLLVVFWRKLTAHSPRWRWAVIPALGLALVMTVLGHDTDLLRLNGDLDPLRTAKGWDVFAARVQQARTNHGATVLIGHRYQEASMMSYYLPDQPRTYLPREKFGSSQFSLWPYFNPTNHPRALYVTMMRRREPVLPRELLRDYPSCEQVDDFWSEHQGRPMMRFRVYLCTRPGAVNQQSVKQ